MDPNQPQDNKTPVTSPAPVTPTQQISIDELENAFEDSIKDTAPLVFVNDPVSQKIGGMEQKIIDLKETDKKIEEKSSSLKTEVSKKLESLKSLKNEIGTLIDEIKELEETRTKIKEEISKLEVLKEEVSSLEKEAESELK